MDQPPVADAHHHLWDLEGAIRYPWLQDPTDGEGYAGNLTPLRHSYLIDDYLADVADSGVVRSVHVQADCDPAHAVAETRWLQTIANARGFPHAIVASVALHRPDAQAVLEAHREHANMRGVRQLLNWHPNPAFSQADRPDYLTDPAWRRGFALLDRYRLSFDLHIYPRQMADAAALAGQFPDTPLVVDHAGLPLERDEAGLDAWRRGLRLLAERPNVSVKVSGLGMLDHGWTAATVRPFIDETIDAFGPERCLFGSNFPVDRLYSDYGRLVSTFRQAIADYSQHERLLMLHDNAVAFYRLAP